MSFVHLTIIYKNTVYHLNVHYRTALRLLEQGPQEFFKYMPGKYKDAGYLVADYDKNVLVNAQDAFTIPKSLRIAVQEVR